MGKPLAILELWIAAPAARSLAGRAEQACVAGPPAQVPGCPLLSAKVWVEIERPELEGPEVQPLVPGLLMIEVLPAGLQGAEPFEAECPEAVAGLAQLKGSARQRVEPSGVGSLWSE